MTVAPLDDISFRFSGNLSRRLPRRANASDNFVVAYTKRRLLSRIVRRLIENGRRCSYGLTMERVRDAHVCTTLKRAGEASRTFDSRWILQHVTMCHCCRGGGFVFSACCRCGSFGYFSKEE
ncbi:hypothetical protein MRX96_003564 [Rhipicephalus microplus]